MKNQVYSQKNDIAEYECFRTQEINSPEKLLGKFILGKVLVIKGVTFKRTNKNIYRLKG